MSEFPKQNIFNRETEDQHQDMSKFYLNNRLGSVLESLVNTAMVALPRAGPLEERDVEI
jgi:hypothetical protein